MRLLVCLLLVVGWYGHVACCSPAAASPPLAAVEQREAEAARLKEEADAAFGAGRFMEALRLLQIAYKLHPDPGLIANQGLVLAKLGQIKRAVDKFELYLSFKPPPDKREMAELHVSRLKPEVILLTQPSGATVYLDGGEKPVGTTPMRVGIVAGSHFVQFRLDGYLPGQRGFDVKLGEPMKVELGLDKRAADDPPPPIPVVVPPPKPVPATPVVQIDIPPPPPPVPDHTWGWVSLGTGGVAAGTAGLFAILTVQALDERDGASSVAEHRHYNDRAQTYEMTTYATIGLAAIAVGMGVYLLSDPATDSNGGADGQPGAGTAGYGPIWAVF